jgi:hypothetical protein
MLKLIKGISAVASAVMVAKSGYELYKSGQELYNSVSKTKKGASKAGKLVKAFKKGLANPVKPN